MEIKADTSPNRTQALTLNKNLISMLTKFKASMGPPPRCRSRKQSGHAALDAADKKFQWCRVARASKKQPEALVCGWLFLGQHASLARFGRIARSVGEPPSARRCRRAEAGKGPLARLAPPP
jgi:hypothetical protein